jgi:hypothetical protein
MKKILSAISALALSSVLYTSANAQVFTVEYLDNSNDTITANGNPSEVKPTIRLNLEAGVDSFTYTWKFSEFTLPEGWNAEGLCDNVICHNYKGSNNDVSDFFKAPFEASPVSYGVVNDTSAISPMDIIYVWLNVPLTASIGIGVFRYTITTEDVYPTAPATPQETEVVHIVQKTTSPSSIKTVIIPQDAVTIYPNPAQNTLKVTAATDLNITTANLVDVQGKVITTVALNGKDIDVQHLNSGMYMVEFFNQDGIKLTTRKFIKE